MSRFLRSERLLFAGLLVASLGVAAFSAIPAGYNGTPYPAGHAPREIPGRINFVDYDIGGLNVTFYADDRAGGYGSNANRTDAGEHPAFYLTWHNDHDFFYPDSNNLTTGGVRYPSTDTSISDWYIGASHPTNYTKWTVHVAKAGKYWISSIWGGENGSFDFTISFLNGTATATTGLVHLKGTNNYHIWRLYPNFATVNLDTGVQVLYFQNASMHLNQDFIFFSADSTKGITSVIPSAPKIATGKLLDISVGLSAEKSSREVQFSLANAGMTDLSVYNCRGQKVMTVVRQNLAAGSHSAKMDTGRLPRGVYLLHIEQNGVRQTVKFQNY
jgi:hypothetical protein